MDGGSYNSGGLQSCSRSSRRWWRSPCGSSSGSSKLQAEAPLRPPRTIVRYSSRACTSWDSRDARSIAGDRVAPARPRAHVSAARKVIAVWTEVQRGPCGLSSAALVHRALRFTIRAFVYTVAYCARRPAAARGRRGAPLVPVPPAGRARGIQRRRADRAPRRLGRRPARRDKFRGLRVFRPVSGFPAVPFGCPTDRPVDVRETDASDS